MPIRVEVDCGTGRVREVPVTDSEIALDRAPLQRLRKAREDEEAAHEAILAKLADAIDVPVDDLKAALGRGQRDGSRA